MLLKRARRGMLRTKYPARLFRTEFQIPCVTGRRELDEEVVYPPVLTRLNALS